MKCPICGVRLPDEKPVCKPCKRGLELFLDDPKLLARASEYLIREIETCSKQ